MDLECFYVHQYKLKISGNFISILNFGLFVST
jgi:hypothetical protein